MKNFFIIKQSVYSLVDGELKEVGIADKLTNVPGNNLHGNILQGSHEVFLLKDGKITTFAEHSTAAYVVKQKQIMPQELRDLRDDSQPLCHAQGAMSDLLYKQYFELFSNFSPKDEDVLAERGLVIMPDCAPLKLFVKDELDEYAEEEITPITKNSFIWRGGLYVQIGKMQFSRLDVKPIFMTPGYIIFWGGGCRLIAMCIKESECRFMNLGDFVSLKTTKVSQLLETSEVRGYSDFYHLGNKLERIFGAQEGDDLYVSNESGEIRRNYDFVMDGAYYPTEETYRLIDGVYKLVV